MQKVPQSRISRQDIKYIALILLIIVIDQVTKALIRSHLALAETWVDVGFFEIIYVQNTGAAFGIFKGIPYVFVAIEIIAIIAIITLYLVFRRRWDFVNHWLVRTGVALMLAGTIGNLIDRLAFKGHVTDFLNFKIWPVFNVADMSTVGGAIVLCYAILFVIRPEQK